MTNTLISIRTLQIECTTLRMALKKYARHTTFCPTNAYGEGKVECDCGWEAIQKQL